MSSKLVDRLNYIRSTLRANSNYVDAHYLLIIKSHFIYVSGGSKTSMSRINKHKLIKGIEVLIDNIERKYWNEIIGIINSSNDILCEISDDLYNQMYGYVTNTNNITDKLFTVLCKRYGLRFLQDYEVDVVSTYERFNELVRCPSADIELLEKVILSHESYFLRNLEEEPLVWVGQNGILYQIQNKSIRNMIYDNLGYNEEVVLYAIDNSNTPKSKIHMKFVNNMIRHRTLWIYSSYTKKPFKEYTNTLCNSYDDIFVLSPMEYVPYHRRAYYTKKLHTMFSVLIREHRVIKQAKNYKPNYTKYVECDECDEGDEGRKTVCLWKLNFRRMFAYHKNLGIIRIKI
jgi:hypothetical protein